MEAFSNVGTIITLSDKPSSNSANPYMYLIIGSIILTIDFQYIADDSNGSSNNNGTKQALGIGTSTAKIGAFNIMSTASSRPLLTRRYKRPGVTVSSAIDEAYQILNKIYFSVKSKLDSESLKFEIKQHICNNT